MSDTVTRTSALAGTGLPQSKERESLSFSSRFDNDWLNPVSMSKLKRAVENGDSEVELNGEWFTITPDIIKYRYSPDEPCIRVKRKDGGFAPFGYISLKRIDEFQFE